MANRDRTLSANTFDPNIFRFEDVRDRVQFNIPKKKLEVQSEWRAQIFNLEFEYVYFSDSDHFLEHELTSNTRRIFFKDMEEFPSNQKQWDVWLSKPDGLLGSPKTLHGDHEYRRQWRSDDQWVKPFKVKELRLESSEAVNEVREFHMMRFYRLVSTDLGSSQNEFFEYLTYRVGDKIAETFLGLDLDQLKRS